MANYLAHYTKKHGILKRKEAVLRRLIAREAEPERLRAAAADVCDARVRMLESRRAQIPPEGSKAERFERIDAEIDAASAASAEDILAEFKAR